MDAMCLELLKEHLVGKKRALDIGSGSGFFTALMAGVLENGFVYGVDHIKELVEIANTNLSKNN